MSRARAVLTAIVVIVCVPRPALAVTACGAIVGPKEYDLTPLIQTSGVDYKYVEGDTLEYHLYVAFFLRAPGPTSVCTLCVSTALPSALTPVSNICHALVQSYSSCNHVARGPLAVATTAEASVCEVLAAATPPQFAPLAGAGLDAAASSPPSPSSSSSSSPPPPPAAQPSPPAPVFAALPGELGVDGVQVTFSDGDDCQSGAVGAKYNVVFQFTCGSDMPGQPVAVTPSDCTTTVVWPTKAACGFPPGSRDGGMSHGTAFLLATGIPFIVYLIGGFVYNIKYRALAVGQSCPNAGFWSALFAYAWAGVRVTYFFIKDACCWGKFGDDGPRSPLPPGYDEVGEPSATSKA